MAKKGREIIAANLMRLMRDTGWSIYEIEKRTSGRVKRSTVDRARRVDGNPTVDSVAEMARAFGLELWQLCVEDVDANNPPCLLSPNEATSNLAPEEQQLLTEFRSLSPAFQQLVLNDLQRYRQAEQQANTKTEPPAANKKGAPTRRRA